jgi:hypothetical protein
MKRPRPRIDFPRFARACAAACAALGAHAAAPLLPALSAEISAQVPGLDPRVAEARTAQRTGE